MPVINDSNVHSTSKRIHFAAIGAGVLSFIALYALLGLLILFSMAWLPEQISSTWLYTSFKVIGLASWALPGFIAARIAGQSGWLHGALTGIGVGILVVLSLIFTFSWDGTLHDNVRSSMLQTFLLAFALCTAGGILVDALVARRRHNQQAA